MNFKFKAILTQKISYWVTFLLLVSSLVFVISVLAINQEATLVFTEGHGPQEINEDMMRSAKTALKRWPRAGSINNVFTVTHVTTRDDYAFISFVEGDLNEIHSNREKFGLTKNDHSSVKGQIYNIILLNNGSGWVSALSNEVDKVEEILRKVPNSKINDEQRKALLMGENEITTTFLDKFTINVEAAQSYGDYRMPWPEGSNFQITQGWHDNTFGYPINHAFDADVTVGSNSNILAMASGVVTAICTNTQQSFIKIQTTGTTESLGYLHINKNTLPYGFGINSLVKQGDVLGQMVEGSVAESCGESRGTHIHIFVPEKPFVIDNVTFSDANNANNGSVFGSNNESCAPGSVNWSILSSCTYIKTDSAPGNVIITNNSVLTIESTATLDVNMASKNIFIYSGSNLYIKNGGKIN